MIKITVEHDGEKETIECDAYLLSVYNEEENGGLRTGTKIEGTLGKGALLLIYTTVKDYIMKWKGNKPTKEQVYNIDEVVNKVIFEKI